MAKFKGPFEQEMPMYSHHLWRENMCISSAANILIMSLACRTHTSQGTGKGFDTSKKKYIEYIVRAAVMATGGQVKNQKSSKICTSLQCEAEF